jgi:hypothetical protein
MAPSDNYEGPKDGIRETRKEDWLQYHIYYSFSPERFKEIELTKEGLFDNFLGEVSGIQVVYLAGTSVSKNYSCYSYYS